MIVAKLLAGHLDSQDRDKAASTWDEKLQFGSSNAEFRPEVIHTIVHLDHKYEIPSPLHHSSPLHHHLNHEKRARQSRHL